MKTSDLFKKQRLKLTPRQKLIVLQRLKDRVERQQKIAADRYDQLLDQYVADGRLYFEDSPQMNQPGRNINLQHKFGAHGYHRSDKVLFCKDTAENNSFLANCQSTHKRWVDYNLQLNKLQDQIFRLQRKLARKSQGLE